ncbi:DNA-binding domain-containing protein [Lactobacillus psittaci]|uniref:Two-component system response regulator n=1 Tax=Lactobacillus psittaci DSM 15354 TaxID=1122152 RepID=A0A0R1SCM3_9LACO|nr:DNA-binding domain-containing protein [Lactobacillus psittaci]KRL63035.1 two-component system response regulator [Lactobacillus psittaci DSM 15354]
MNYYIVDSNTENCSKLKEVIEADFDSNVIGISDDANRAYEEVIQLHVDIMIVAYEINQRHQGIELIQKLRKVGSKPHFVMTGHNLTSQEKHQIYSHGIEVIINTPVKAVEARQMLHLLASYANLINRLNEIYRLSSISSGPFARPQAMHREQTDHIDEVLRFLGIASEPGIADIRKIINLMCDQDIEFSLINFERDLNLDNHAKKVIFQRIRRTLKVGITNLATMCIDYPENDILLDYANNLFEYKNIHNEIEALESEKCAKVEISLQHFFNGLLEESKRVQK